MVSLKKVLVSNHKVKTVNFPGRKSEKQSDDLIIYVGTNDLTNNVNLLANVKKILKEVSKESPLTSIAISSIIKGKDKTDIRKNQTDTNVRLKMFRMQKAISVIDNGGVKEFHLGKRKSHLNRK